MKGVVHRIEDDLKGSTELEFRQSLFFRGLKWTTLYDAEAMLGKYAKFNELHPEREDS
ncbi:MAG: hypothetical protein K0S82_1790 [Gaiellaceae bacterium]|jgi:hypothetical protein|nr:hypothetical protein [Gaiellaceae bacterium]